MHWYTASAWTGTSTRRVTGTREETDETARNRYRDRRGPFHEGEVDTLPGGRSLFGKGAVLRTGRQLDKQHRGISRHRRRRQVHPRASRRSTGHLLRQRNRHHVVSKPQDGFIPPLSGTAESGNLSQGDGRENQGHYR